MEEINLDKCYDVIMELVKEGGKMIKENMQKQKTISEKTSDTDLVTETDENVEKLLIDGIKANFPDHKFICEESTKKVEFTNSPTWIIDPVDGTMNFVHSFPHVCISVGFYVDKKPKIGIIYNPIYDQLFTARKGQGAFLNGKEIRVSGQTDLAKSLVMVEIGTRGDPMKLETSIENLKRITPLVHGTRALGSCALIMCMVALGAADIMHEYGMSIWDIAAGNLIVTEAGGICIDPSGGDLNLLNRRVLCAASRELADKFIQKIVSYYPVPH